MKSSPYQTLLAENAELRARLEEAEEALRAIRSGEVDALVVETDAGAQVFTLQGMDAESNRFRGEILGQISDAVIAFDDDAHVTYLNAAAERQYGVTASEVLGRHLTQVYQARWPQPEDETQAVAVVHETGHWQGEYAHVKRDGEVIHVDSSLTLLRAANGNRSGMLAVIRDITRRKQAEDAVHASEARFRSLFENNLEAMFLTVPDGKVIAANPAACAMFGMSEAELCRVGRNGIMNHADPRHAAALAERARTGSLRTELTYVRKDGTVFPAEVQSVILDNATHQAFVAMRDITERKRAEESLAAAHRQTQDIIDNTTAIVYAFDLQGRFVIANVSVAKLLNSTPAQMIGKRRHDFMPQADADWHEANDRKVIESGRALDFEEQSELPGRSITWLTTKFPLRDTEGKIYAIGGFSMDISGRRQAEIAQAALAAIVESCEDAIISKNLEGTVTSWNAGAERLFGYRADEMIGQPVARIIPPEFQAEEDTILDCLCRGQSIARFESVRLAGDGRRIPVSLTISPIRDASGTIIGASKIARDITERKQAEAALRSNEKKLTDIYNSMSEGLAIHEMICDESGQAVDYRYIDVNPAFEHITGLQRSMVIGQMASVLYGIGEAPYLDTYADVAATGKPISFEAYFDPMQRHFHISVFSPGTGKFATTFQDITARRRAEEALRASEAQLRLAQESANVGIWDWQVETGALDFTPELNKLYGLPPGTIKTYQDWRVRVHPDDISGIEAARDAAIAKHEPFDLEFRGRHSSGEYRWISTKGGAIYDETGTPVRVFGVNIDITARKQAEEQIKASLAEKEVLLKEIHHRVKNNLQVISSLVSLQADSLADDRAREALGDIGTRIRAIALVHEKFYQTDNLAQLDFADYAASLLNHLWHSHGSLAGKVRLALAMAHVVMPIEPAVTCGLILNELAGNALKHAFPNGRGGEVTVGLDHDPATDTVCLWVRDDGVGLPEGLEWRQAKSLGLRLVRILASQLGATADTGPGPGPGTEFRVTFIQKSIHS
jgi:PAS domain S-box-containing protein